MRFAAFGGVRYGERARLGKWPALPDGDLTDLVGLPKGAHRISFGCGLVGSGPCIVIRERQSEADRGGYAYTVLLDPGEEIWHAYQWNGAQMIAAILDDASLRALMMSSPERAAGAPDVLLARLAAVACAVRPEESAVSGLAEALAAGLTRASPVLLKPAVASQVAPSQVARVLASLPVCLRGVGWLVGGTMASASTFGAQVVVDDRDLDDSTSAEHDTAGLLADLKSLDTVDVEPPVRDLLDRPAWFWDASRSHVAVQLHAFAALRGGRANSAAIGARFAGADIYAPPLREVLLTAVTRHLSDGAARFDGETSRIAVEMWLGSQQPLAPEVIRAIAPEVVCDWLRSHNLRPDAPSIVDAALSDEQWLFLWRRDVRASASPAAQVNRLAAAANTEMTRGGPVTTRLQELRHELLEAQLKSGGGLRQWADVGDSRLVDERTALRLEQAVRDRLAGRDESIDDYLILGNDAGGCWLAEAHPSRCVDAAEAALRLCAADGRAAAAAAVWLDAAAATAVRRALPIALKLRVADAVGGEWTALSVVRALWLTARVPSADSAMPGEINEEEIAAVIGTGEAGAIGDLDLSVFARLFRRLSPGLLSQVLRSPRASTIGVFTANVKWLARHDQSELLEAWLKGLCAGGQLPELCSGDVPRAVLGRLVEWLLTGPEEWDGLHGRALASLVQADSTAREALPLVEAFREVSTAVDRKYVAQAALFRRFAGQRSVLEFAANALPRRQFLNLLEAGYRSKPAAFVTFVENERRAAGAAESSVLRLLQELLQTPAGRDARADLGGGTGRAESTGRFRALWSKLGVR